MKKLLIVMVCLVLLSYSVFAGGGAGVAEETTVVTAVKFLDNPYQINWIEGGEMFAEWAGLPHVAQACQASSEKQINDIKAMIAKTNGNVVFNIDPNESPDVVPLAKLFDDAGVYFVTWWNKPDDVKVTDYKHWVCHVAFPGKDGSYFNSTTLFKTFDTPNKGKIIAVQGQLANAAQIERWKGLMLALEENPGVELVAYESGDWDRTKAYNLISNMLVAHPDVDGVWAANDNMCMGSIEALRAAGLAGEVLVTGYDGNEDVARAIVAGEAAATVGVDPRWQGGEGLALALAAHRGELDVASLPAEKRQWWADQIYVDAENAQWYIDNFVEGTAEYDYTELWDRWLRGME